MIYSIRYWLGRKLSKLSGWLLRGYPSFAEINYNGKPVKRDLTQYRQTDIWDREYRLEGIFAEPPKDKK